MSVFAVANSWTCPNKSRLRETTGLENEALRHRQSDGLASYRLGLDRVFLTARACNETWFSKAALSRR